MEELEMNPVTSTEDTVIEEIAPEDNMDSSEEVEVTENETHDNDGDTKNAVDYRELERQDLEELKSIFPHLSDKTSITELDNPLRYAALRDLGLTPKEAYLATSEPIKKYDNRSHLRSSVPRSAAAPRDILTRGELEAARELFSGLSDREIQKLYKKVSR